MSVLFSICVSRPIYFSPLDLIFYKRRLHLLMRMSLLPVRPYSENQLQLCSISSISSDLLGIQDFSKRLLQYIRINSLHLIGILSASSTSEKSGYYLDEFYFYYYWCFPFLLVSIIFFGALCC